MLAGVSSSWVDLRWLWESGVAELWPHLSSVLVLALALVASGHAILTKREVRSAIGWVGVIWMVPVLGAVLYSFLGINRIRRRAVALRGGARRYRALDVSPLYQAADDEIARHGDHLTKLAALIGRVTSRPLLQGNRITPLVNGDEAYPVMLEAIEAAQHSVLLSTYIFDTSQVGRKFVDALGRAKQRGVLVRVLVDDVGARYSQPPVTVLLRRAGVRIARFIPAWLPKHTPYFNLRNHRKLLIVDHTVAFTGGMNIRRGHVLAAAKRHPIRDLHFKVEGPVVSQLQDVFVHDWAFAARERLEPSKLGPLPGVIDTVLARGIADGPDEDVDAVLWCILGAIGCARESIRVVTPYFLPDPPLATALNVAAMRGVRVDIVLPERCNLRIVQWAMWAQLWQVLGRGCRVWLTPPPFDHSKLMIVDDRWVLVGSANWDPRSLRLNFEFCIECYGDALAVRLTREVDERIRMARELTVEEHARRKLWRRLRDGLARLLQPYL
jgi:cardiolipin synthase A/B